MIENGQTVLFDPYTSSQGQSGPGSRGTEV